MTFVFTVNIIVIIFACTTKLIQWNVLLSATFCRGVIIIVNNSDTFINDECSRGLRNPFVAVGNGCCFRITCFRINSFVSSPCQPYQRLEILQTKSFSQQRRSYNSNVWVNNIVVSRLMVLLSVLKTGQGDLKLILGKVRFDNKPTLAYRHSMDFSL